MQRFVINFALSRQHASSFNVSALNILRWEEIKYIHKVLLHLTMFRERLMGHLLYLPRHEKKQQKFARVPEPKTHRYHACTFGKPNRNKQKI